MKCSLLSQGTKFGTYARTLVALPELSHRIHNGTLGYTSGRSRKMGTWAQSRERSPSPSPVKVQQPSRRRKAFNAMSSFFLRSAQNQDLKRFLQEVGTDPREARYWLRQFQASSETERKPFAVIEIESSVFENSAMLEKLCSSVSFLHRNQMKCAIVLGYSLPESRPLDAQNVQKLRKQLTSNILDLASELESQGAMATPIFPGCNLLTVESSDSVGARDVHCDDASLLDWAFQTEHIPIIQSIAENQHGQLVPVDIRRTMHTVSAKLQPRKVLFVNTIGGFTDEHDEIVANINLSPANLKMTQEKPWCTGVVRQKIDYVGKLLTELPRESSVVITSAEKLLVELFTHHGSGTFFKMTEPIHKYSSLQNVDKNRLFALINRSFGRDLKKDYFDRLIPKLKTLYLSEDYNAAAIITAEEDCGVPYLDKFAVSMAKQGVGYGEMLWDCIQRDCKHLYWRSRLVNKINPWYFKRCTGSMRQGDWIVFWYGLHDHNESIKLIGSATHIPNSFTSKGSGEDNTLVD